jgi:molybdenum cofactor biosynthesis protein A, bacterial
MPFDEYTWIERNQVLSFEEIVRLARIFREFGIQKVRLTGGEPLVRRDLDRLVRQLNELPGLEVSLTTNGALLGEQAAGLFDAGLHRINVSLDSLRPDRFKEMTKRGDLSEVLAGLDQAKRVGMKPIKINAVIIRGTNDDEIIDLVQFARSNGYEMRFIEYMDVGNANAWTLNKTVTKQEILDAVHKVYPVREVGRDHGSAPAVDYEFLDGSGEIGIIGSVTEPFCSSCTRVRLTADGKLVTCLFSASGFDIKSLLRTGISDDDLNKYINNLWSLRVDRYSDLRWVALQSGAGYEPQQHKKIEMITLGG